MIFFIEKPSRPRGPIKVFDIQKTSISIAWKHPEDDGGCPLTGFIIEKKEAHRQYWNTVEQVLPAITSYCVQSLTQNTEYDFRVTAVNKIGHSDPLVTDGCTMAKSPFGMCTYPFILHYCFLILICP